MKSSLSKNILGTELKECSCEPMTGFYRDGFCSTGEQDLGSHTVCAVLTDEFLDYTANQENDLKTPRPEFNFPGLKAGDQWCLCASRWLEAQKAGVAPKVILESCEASAIKIIPEELLLEYSHKTSLH